MKREMTELIWMMSRKLQRTKRGRRPSGEEYPLAEKTMGIGQDKSIRQYADVPAERVSLKAKLEVMKAKVAGGDTEKPMPQKVKGKEETL